MSSSTPTPAGFADLPLEIRHAIWNRVYAMQDARVVEVGTAAHDHYDEVHDWCPWMSPSSRPFVTNICHEARSTAHGIARLAGHLIFQNPRSIQGSSADIYFNPEIDTLYARNEKEYWIRDWGPEGVLTELWTSSHPERLRYLAIELDPLTRATRPRSLHTDLCYFSQMEKMTFVVKEDSAEAQALLHVLDIERYHIMRDGCMGSARPRQEVSRRLEHFKLAVVSRGRLEYIVSPP